MIGLHIGLPVNVGFVGKLDVVLRPVFITSPHEMNSRKFVCQSMISHEAVA